MLEDALLCYIATWLQRAQVSVQNEQRSYAVSNAEDMKSRGQPLGTLAT